MLTEAATQFRKQELLVSGSLHFSQRLGTVIECFNFDVTCRSASAILSLEEASMCKQHTEASLLCTAEAGTPDGGAELGGDLKKIGCPRAGHSYFWNSLHECSEARFHVR